MLVSLLRHPAIIIAGAFIIASAGRELWPLRAEWSPLPWIRNVGQGLIVAGMLMLILAYGALARSGQPIDPRRPTTRIVSAGVYGFSRNPIYLGWFIVLLGAGLENASLFQVTTSLIMIGVLHWAVVLREEGHLEETLSDEYVRYRRSVRRWL